MTEAEKKRAIFAAVDDETRRVLQEFALVFGPLKNPRGWTDANGASIIDDGDETIAE